MILIELFVKTDKGVSLDLSSASARRGYRDLRGRALFC